MLHASVLAPHPGNIREDTGDITETAASILAHGILQPLTVIPREDKAGHYYVIAGNRRLAAARKARLEQIPVIIRRDGLTPPQVTEIMLVENCQRSDLGPVEKAEAMGRLRRAGYTAARIAQATGLSASAVSYHLTLLDADQATRDRVRAGTVTVGDVVSAVRGTRQRGRPKGSRPGRPRVVEPRHFTRQHPLAAQAAALCRHTDRPRYGSVACGQCFEAVIRADERAAARAGFEAESRQAALSRAAVGATAAVPVFREPATVS
jgi:ParB family transcriptional regulator, chromosome partitioning protein